MAQTHLDDQLLDELKMVLEEEFPTLITEFINDSEKRIDALRAAVYDKDGKAIREYSHSFKGSSCNIGAVTLSEYCHEAENCGRDNRLDNIEELIEKIEQEYSHVKENLENRLH